MNPFSQYKAERIASIAHEANRAYCAAIGDLSQPAWDDTPLWQKESAVNGVLFNVAHPEAGDSASHDNWLQEKRAAGWEYGSVKDSEKKLHPCMVPFADLPLEQQIKDRLFRAVVHALLEI